MSFPELSEEFRVQRLVPPRGRVRMILDTDTYNEIDDQFALAYALLADDAVSLEAVCAAPFHNDRSSGPADGMEKSLEEIKRILKLFDRSPEGFAFAGSREYLRSADDPVRSPAADQIIELAPASAEDDPLYVVAIGAITNVASALLLEPELVRKIVVVWLGGQSYDWPTATEFNLKQDPVGARVLFDCGVPLVHVPCNGVATHLLLSIEQLRAQVGGANAVADFLVDTFAGYYDELAAGGLMESAAGHAKVIWDIATVAYLVNPDWVLTRLTQSPLLTSDLTWSSSPSRHLIRVAWFVRRNPIFMDFFRRLAAHG